MTKMYKLFIIKGAMYWRRSCENESKAGQEGSLKGNISNGITNKSV